jgi:hypothetical protein
VLLTLGGTVQEKNMEIKFTIDNAAFEGENFQPEVARILAEIAEAVKFRSQGNIRDANGNLIGEWRV